MVKSVFLIHSSLDKDFARRVAIDLTLAGITVWLDEAEIKSEQHLINIIDDSVSGTIYLAALLSENSVNSSWIQHGIELAWNRGVPGRQLQTLSLLYKNCEIPKFLTSKPVIDFRDPARYGAAMDQIFSRIVIGRYVKGEPVPHILAGMWRGAWKWYDRPREAVMFISSLSTCSSKMVIRYLKSGILTIVHEEIDTQISGNEVKLNGVSYRFLEQGIALEWRLNRFKLTMDETGSVLKGTQITKKGVHEPVLFKRKP